jgi:hypothetical protein
MASRSSLSRCVSLPIATYPALLAQGGARVFDVINLALGRTLEHRGAVVLRRANGADLGQHFANITPTRVVKSARAKHSSA